MKQWVYSLLVGGMVLFGATSASFGQCGTQGPGGTICGNRTGGLGPNGPLTNPVLGIPGTSTGQIGLAGSSSGTATIKPQNASGSPTLTLPNLTGTIPSTATSPITLDAITGALACPTCLTGGGGSLTVSSPLNIAGSNISLRGATGSVVMGSGGTGSSFTPNPVLGVSGSSIGSIGLQNATSGTETIQPANGALGSGIATLAAGTYNLVGDNLSQALTNKTYNGLSISPTTGTLTIANGKTLTDTSGVGASVLLGAVGGGFTGYAGQTCTNQAVSALSAAAGLTCSTITNSFLASMVANTIKGAATAGNPTDLAVPSCSTATSALIWTTNTGFGCNSFTAAAWTNTRLAKTSAYTVVSADTGSTLALGGNAFFVLTFNDPSTYTTAASFLVLNEDTAAGKLIVPKLSSSATSQTIGTGSKVFTTSSGLPIIVYNVFNSSQRYRVYSLANPANYMVGTVSSYSGTSLTIAVDGTGGTGTFTDWQIAPEIKLWPGQSRWVFNQNNVWNLDPPKRWKQPNETELCTDAGGNDSNDGLGTPPNQATRCLRHIAYAASLIQQEWDANHFPPDIGLWNGPFDENVMLRGQMVGYNFINFNTRAANTWQNSNLSATSSSAACISVADFAIARLVAQFGVTQTWACNQANATNTGDIFGHQKNIIDLVGSHIFQSGGTNDSPLYEDGEGRATIAGDTTGGSAAGITIGRSTAETYRSFVNCQGAHCAVTTGGVLTYGGTGTLTITTFYTVKSGGNINHSTNPAGTAASVGAASSQGLSVIQENGLTLPGGAPALSNGGIACTTSC